MKAMIAFICACAIAISICAVGLVKTLLALILVAAVAIPACALKNTNRDDVETRRDYTRGDDTQ